MPKISSMISLPLAPSWKRYKNLFLKEKKNLSILRTLQYEMLRKASLGKKILDFGGGDKAKYHHIISYELYQSINIDPDIQPTWVTQVREPFPSPKNHYDTVISLNVFEHIFDVKFILEEIYKSLRPSGNIFFSTPFLFPIHAHPDDYFRPTSSWINEALVNAGFKNITITPLVWGKFSTAITASYFTSSKTLVHLFLITDLLYLHLRRLLKRKPLNDNLSNIALGYFVEAFKHPEKPL